MWPSLFTDDIHFPLTGQKEFLIITGPNMGGKSTYIRQVCGDFRENVFLLKTSPPSFSIFALGEYNHVDRTTSYILCQASLLNSAFSVTPVGQFKVGVLTGTNGKII